MMAQNVLPDESMVVFGRGKTCNGHPGNTKMRSILSNYKGQYQSVEKGEKAKLVQKIYGEMVGEGMKFVKPSEQGDGWVEVDAQTAMDKLRHSLRNPRVGLNLKVASRSQAEIHQRSKSKTARGSLNPTIETSVGISSQEAVRPRLQQSPSTSHSSVSGTTDVGVDSLQPDGDSSVQNTAEEPLRPELLLTRGSSFVPTNITQEPFLSTWPWTSGLQCNASGTSSEQMNTVLSGFPITCGLLDGNALFANNSLNRLAQMEMEWQRLSPSTPMSSLAISRQLPLLSSSQPSVAAAAAAAAAAYAYAMLSSRSNTTNSQVNSVPDDPLYWIRLALASLGREYRR